jgi:outer membrane protein TolC
VRNSRTTQLLLFAAALALILATSALAAPPQVDPSALTLEESLSLALDHSAKLQEAKAKVALARLDVKATHWGNWLIPKVSTHQGFDFLSGQERRSIAFSLDLAKFLGEGQREAEKARIGLEQAERAVAEARGELIAEVTRAFFHLTATKAAVQVREEEVAQALKLQALQQIRFEHGTGDLAPLLQAQEALARARLDLLRAQHEARLAELALLRAIGLPLP